MTAPSDTADKFMLRLPYGLRQQIADDAKASGRSMNAEIVHRLQNNTSTLRDQFAGQVAAGLSTGTRLEFEVDIIAEDAYRIADAMLAARAKGN